MTSLLNYRNMVAVGGALFAAGCATTTDPHECANRGLAAAACHGAVAQENKRLEKELEQQEDALSDLSLELEAAQAKEAALQSRVAGLKKRLATQQSSIRGLKASLDRQLTANRITQERYDALVTELNGVNAKIERFSNLTAVEYSEATANELEGFLDSEIVVLTDTIQEGALGL